MTAREVIEECLNALDEELAAWDLSPPLQHVLQARDHCVEWLAANAPPPPEKEPT